MATSPEAYKELPSDPERRYSGVLAGANRLDALDVVIVVVILLLSGMALISIVADWPKWVAFLNVLFLAILGFLVAYRRMVVRPDHVRAQQSDRLMHIAREGVSFLRSGLNPETADAVCRIVLRETGAAAAIAITDQDEVLGFAGVGHDHHSSGRPIVTRATQETLDKNEPQILASKPEIGCPDANCPLVAAIVVPLQLDEKAVGTLKFYYTSEKYLNETELAMAEGLASLLSVQLEIHQLEKQAGLATKMELKALQAQINPHFLFNTLNTISAYIRTDPVTARHLLRQFAAFYRHTLEHGDAPITLSLEVDFLRQYFELEKARFDDRVALTLDVDEDAFDMPMPAFMLQPLVENAIGHGMRPTGEPLHITVSGHYDANKLKICVADNGVGMNPDKVDHIFEKSAGKGLGIALRNVRDRVRGFYGEESQFLIESEEGVGTRAWFIIDTDHEY